MKIDRFMHKPVPPCRSFLARSGRAALCSQSWGEKPTVRANNHFVKSGYLLTEQKSVFEHGTTATKTLLATIGCSPIADIPVLRNPAGGNTFAVQMMNNPGNTPFLTVFCETTMVGTNE